MVSTVRSRRSAGPLALLADGVVVLVFAAIGRRSHAESGAVLGVLATAWPFLAGVVAGWLVARGWRRPVTPSTGVAVWLAAVVVGMLLRRVVGDGTAPAFVAVATVFLGVTLLGWREVVRRLARRTSSRDRAGGDVAGRATASVRTARGPARRTGS